MADGMPGMRVLKAVTIGMAVLIVVGTGVLVAVIVHRSNAPAGRGVPAGGPGALSLDEPAGTHIAGIAGAGGRLAVQLQGGGGDRVVLVDPASGVVTGRIVLAR